tara:strand:+ start:16589 stop:18418 length:1830 start_codon:yes stop_codon:yes gene_type:complete
MSYESLERELARRQSLTIEELREKARLRRGGRKGSKTRTRLAEGEDKLGKALAAARERAAKYAKPRLNITKLPDREQLSLKDFDAETFGVHGDYPVKVFSYSVDVHKDDYEQGEVGDSVHYWRKEEDDFDFDTKAQNEEELLKILNEMIRVEVGRRVPTHKKADFGFDMDNAYTDVHATYEEGQGMGFYDYPNEHEREAWKRGKQELFSLGFTFEIEPVDESYAETFDAETFKAEDEVIVVEGYRPKRVESMGNVALFYIGPEAERHYTHPLSPYQGRMVLPNGTPGTIINPAGITIQDVDEVMQHRTGAPWSGEYVLWVLEDGGRWADSSQSRMYTFDSEEFRAEPAMYVKCFECEKPGYSDEMSKIAFGHLCARCARPEINWGTYSAESGLNNTHRDILTYLSPFNPELVHRKYGIPAGLTQREIGNAIGTVRTNATKHLQDLIELGLVTQIMRRPDGERRKVKVYLPTYEGRKIAESFRAEDLNGNGVIDAWETHAHENTLTGLAHEETHFSETFRANLRKTNLKPSQIREKAQEAFEGVTGWMWLSELTGKINSTLGARQRIAPGVVSRAIGSSTGGRDGFYITLNKRIFYYGDKDRGEFIKGVI